jgi:zeta-carotene desaturase
MKPDVIIGGGFAGLAAGVALADQGRRVLLLERRSFLGGRAYSFLDRTTGDTVDNGQHLMMGCYHSTLAFLEKIGSRNNLRFQKDTRVDFLDATEGRSVFRCPPLPAPLHLVLGLGRLGSVPWSDRIRALRVGMAVRAGDGNQSSLAEKTVTQWLGELGQSEVVQKRFWNPMAVATLNESPDRASADMFARVIHDGFLQSRQDSELVISKVGLSDYSTSRMQPDSSSSGVVTFGRVAK